MSFRQPDIEKTHASRRKLSAWVLIVLYGVVITILIFMIVANQTPVESPLVETITQASCLSAETLNCSPAHTLNAPFFIGLFVALAGILILFIKPWKPLSNRNYRHASSH